MTNCNGLKNVEGELCRLAAHYNATANAARYLMCSREVFMREETRHWNEKWMSNAVQWVGSGADYHHIFPTDK
jgi:hypothetical protein